MRNGSTAAIAARSAARPARRGRPSRRPARSASSSSRADRRHDPVDLAREAVHEPRLERRRGRLADHARRLDEVDLASRAARAKSASIEISIPGASTPPTYSPSRRDDVEVRRGAEVDDDARRAVALLRGDGVDDPVGPDLARVVVADRDPRLDARADDEQLRCAQRVASRSHSRTSAGTVEERQIPSTRPRSRSPPSRTPSSSPVRCASVARRQCSASASPS